VKLTQTRIVTNNVPLLREFYRDVTGMAPEGDDHYVEFHATNLNLAISSQRIVDLYSNGATAPAANRSVILDFEVEDVDKERKRLSAIVSEFVLEPTTQPWGNKSMLFRDPDGNLINFYTRETPDET
jgi:catechol 2,3-dioxygenase-like lactoylglutathione lyase family enzyme